MLFKIYFEYHLVFLSIKKLLDNNSNILLGVLKSKYL